jgi:2-polyprenyl-3-methyl-5-hydroxy-6-metoxy-1,4-benzoquinol methylase
MARAARRVLATVGVGASQHNMNEDAGELFYREQYLAALEPHLRPASRVLDVGCQFGRIAIPLADRGHHVVGTDIDAACLDYIRRQRPDIELRLEAIEDTASGPPRDPFDLVIVLEVLYLIAGWRDIIAGLARQLRPGGHLAVSHRSHGYLIHRLLREGRYDELDQALAGNHPATNAQSPAELRRSYDAIGLDVTSITPVGMFSGIHVDPFAAIVDPSRLDQNARQRLARFEADPNLQARFAESARYLLVVATPRRG